MNGLCWLWEEWHIVGQLRGGYEWLKEVIRCRADGLRLLRRSGKFTHAYVPISISRGRSVALGSSQSHSFKRRGNLSNQHGTIARVSIDYSSQFETALGQVLVPALTL